MKRLTIILIFTLSLFACKVAGQCVTVGSNVTICQGSTLTNLGGKTLNGTTNVLWSDNGAGGLFSPDATTLNASWTPLSTFTGPASLTLSATAGCSSSPASASLTVTVTALPVATFSYNTNPYCSNESNPSPTFGGGGIAGTFSSIGGLVFVSTSTGQINLSASTAGTYTVTNSIPSAGGCGAVTANSPITITTLPAATIFYSGSPWCSIAGVQNVTLVGTSGGIYSAVPAGLSINISTGAITTGTSIAGTYTVTYTIGASGGCGPTSANTSVMISPTPSAPGVGSITQTTCSVTTGSVVLIDLPSTGAWILTRSPGSVTTAGSGITTTISNLAPGSYTFTVTSSAGCVSPSSANVVINAQPASPASPVQSVNCSQGFDHAVVTVISPTGAGLEYSFDGGVYQSGLIFNSVNNGSHFLSVRNASGCTTTGTLFSVSCGCINPPTLTLSSSSGSTCGTTAMTVTGNSFGGTATSVTISSNGAGNVNPSSINTSPFVFTYTPDAADGGKIVIITVATNNPLGAPCAAAVAAYSLTVNALPAAPVVGTITNLTCTAATGSVILNGLPAIGTWTLIRNPGTIVTNGTGTSTTVTGLVAGTYNFMVTSAEGCTSVVSSDVVITPQPSSPPAPVIGIITQPTCAISTGSVVLSGLPGTGTWLLTRNPGGVTISDSGTTAVSVLPAGTYTFTVTNTTGCISSPSGNVLVNTQPPIPAAPSIGAITPPTCTLSTGSVNLSGLPSSGTWTLIRYPGTVSTSGTGTNTTISGLASGSYNFTVTTADGCLSVPSANVVIPVQPTTPSAPAVGTIIQPTFEIPTGSVLLSELPSTGSWVITILPGGVTTIGTGTSKTLTNLWGGVFTFKVTNSAGCTSTESIPVTISTPGVPVLIITDPSAVCSPTPVDITDSTITSGSTPGLIYTYWTDADATISYNTPTTSTAGTYYIKGTTVSGYFSIKPVIVMVDQLPISNAGIDQTLDYTFSTTLNAILINNETGIWSLVSGSGNFYDNTDPKTQVSGLSPGDNILLWTVKRGVCPAVFDTVTIFVHNLVIPSLITPNMDGRNDYFVIRGLVNLGKTQLFVFDRRGAEVYKNMDYDNLWNGVDYNNNPLPDDTYFYVLKSTNGKPVNGYIVIRH